MPPLNPSVGLLVSVVRPPSVTDTVTPPDRAAELAVNSSICSDPPPETGMLTMPRYLKSVIVADPAESTDAAAAAVRPDGAPAFFRAVLLPLELADLGLPDLPLAEGEALTDAEGVDVGAGLAVAEGPAVVLADGLGDAGGPDDGAADGVGLEVVGLGLGADGVGVGRQSIPRMQLPPFCGEAAALAAPPVPSSPATSTAGIAATASIRCPAASRTRRSLPSDAGAACSGSSASGSSASGSSTPPSRSSAASSPTRAGGAASTDSGSAGTQA